MRKNNNTGCFFLIIALIVALFISLWLAFGYVLEMKAKDTPTIYTAKVQELGSKFSHENVNKELPYVQLEPETAITETHIYICTINADMVNFRRGAGTQYPRVDASFFFVSGMLVNVQGKAGGWLEVMYDDVSGFIKGEYCE